MASIVKEVLAVPPELKAFVVSKPALELPHISAKTIRDTTELHLAGKGIECLCGFDRFVNLEILYLNNNRLTNLDGLEPCFRIKTLFADHNQLVTLEGPIRDMKFLNELDVSHNKLADLDWQLETLERVQYLQTLQLDGNPCSQEMGYRSRVIAAVPSLKILDGQAISAVERVEAEREHSRRGAARGRTTRSGMAPACTFGRGRPGVDLSTGLELTRTGKPMFGAEGDTLLQRTLRSEARHAKRAAREERRRATLRSIAAAGKGKSWKSISRRARAEGRAGGAVRSLLSQRGMGLVDDAVVGSMLSRGCSLEDTRRAGLGLLADASAAARAADAATRRATSSSFERKAEAMGASRSGAGARAGGSSGKKEKEEEAKRGGASGWSAARRQRETRRDVSSLTDDMKSLTGSVQSGSTSATSSLLGSVGQALRRSRSLKHLAGGVGGQAMAASKAGGVAKGQLGEWELLRLKKLFREHDADGSGSLALPEFRAALAAAVDWGFVAADASDDGVSRVSAQEAFNALDTDGSGSVSFTEFVSVLREQARPAGGMGDKHKLQRLSLQFRTLTIDEASHRARTHFKTASGIHKRLLRMDPEDPKRERLEKQALALSEKGTRLVALVRRLEGAADPPERPPPPRKPRRDFRTFIQSVPEREARKTLRRGMRDYKVPPPGEESDSESDDDEGKQVGEDVDDYRKTVRARKPHVVLKATVDV